MSHSCRLCLTEDSEAYSKIETEHCLKQLKSVVPEIDLTLTEGPVICTKCSDSLFHAYTFKLNCLMTEKTLQLSLNKSQCKIKYKSEHKSKDEDEIAIDQNTNNSREIKCTKEEPTILCEKLQDNTKDSMSEDDVTTQKPLNENAENKLGSKLTNYKGWVEHVESHIRNDNSCAICAKRFKTRTEFLKHRDTHRVNKCPSCGEEFLYKSTFSKHMKEQHTGEQLPENPVCNVAVGKFKCDVCGLKSKSKCQLIEHIRIHTGERPYKCTICSKAFAQTSTLSTHIKSVHLPERPHQCEICGKGFPVRGAYTAHMKTHANLPNNFVCHHCGKVFPLQGRLTQHMRRHSPQKTIVCHICSKGFFDMKGLKKHMRIHTGEKPFECTICLKRFTQQYNMKIHLRSCAKRTHRTKTEQTRTN